jgi:hypothetical protein
MAVDVELASVLNHGAGLVGLPLRGGDVHLLQDRLQIINTMSMKGSDSVVRISIHLFLSLSDPDPLVRTVLPALDPYHKGVERTEKKLAK